MTTGTDFPGLPRLLADDMGNMRWMTLKTLNLGHLRQMRLMTVLTCHLAAMLAGVTLAAIKIAMLVRILLIETLLVVVAGKTNRAQLLQICQRNFQRLMRVVTTNAIFERKMPPPGSYVTAAAILRSQLTVRLMFRVAGGTAGKLLQVCSAFGKQIIGLLLMAGGAEAGWKFSI